MTSNFVPVAVLANQLESCNGSDFQILLRHLRSQNYIKENLLKSELSLLSTKILKLLNSGNNYQLWKGCHAATVICSYNPLVLCSFSGQFLAAVYSKLEQKVNYYNSIIDTQEGKVILECLVSTSSILMDQMRNKPTVSREGLVPKLKAIIPTFITLCQYQPKLCLPVLKNLLYKNSTTFKPFVNKYRVVLTNLINIDYDTLDKETQKLICVNYAYLHLIKIQATAANDDDATKAHHKLHQDEAWRTGLFSVLGQFKDVFELCGEILDLEHDKELYKLIESLPTDLSKTDNKSLLELSNLNLDMNKPLSLWKIPQRLNLLVDLLSAFISLPTPYPVRIPIGGINAVCESALSLTQNFIPLKRDLRRDRELTAVINLVLSSVQFSGIKLWKVMIDSYGKHCLSYLPNILSSLELFIPLQQKSTKINFEACTELKSQFLLLFSIMNSLSKHVGHQLNELDLINKLIDVSLVLVEDSSLIETLFDNIEKSKIDASKTGKSKSKKSQNRDKIGTITDIYTHPSQFVIKESLVLFDEVNSFLCFVLSNWKLNATQHVKIINYSISRSLSFKQTIRKIPSSFVKLLRTVTIYPGSDHISILPIAVDLLKEFGDPIFDVMIHPRLPMSIIHSVAKPLSIEVNDIKDDDVENEQSDDQTKLMDMSNAGEISESQENSKLKQMIEDTKNSSKIVVDETKLFKKRSMQETEKLEESKRIRVDQTSAPVTINQLDVEVTKYPEAEQVENVIISNTVVVEEEAAPVNESEDEDSEFEIPDIVLSGDEDDE
ncbi:hypothetical protein TPHA_0L00230 [Tetrapisispora phaffii CBS 4417]|uniref:Pre-rRNA-processing protein RIX1 n=1 Tax=Tetrapisispora phaffii (strain ATCC 24235 / CBS 4417 / NBRC 1672 / NRRL Y-8282 / UCD 70-5) TaxID=1071381 RepID=G8BZQ2_TETPH|nr:hypothetical protein TPHA_0L00230 [Tetrapisispora phaffii CBS 4417]CCE65380.1 hypothetical protein TPHA_0L00230 [Tetrapisispora phaffii CBS 4417]